MMLQILSAVAVAGAACSSTAAADPIDIGSRLEPFVDDYLIEKMTGAELVLHRPTPREVAIVHDEPWEGASSYYHTVFRDDDLYRMYYRGCNWNESAHDVHEVICYAHGKDGIRWTKPDLGLAEFNGSKKNNIIWSRSGPVKFPPDLWRSLGSGAVNFSVFKDTNPACTPEEKYKAFGGDPAGNYAFKSSDGIHWSLLSDKPVIPPGGFTSKFDAQSTMFWDSVRDRYVSFHKAARQASDGVWYRDLITATSDDFLHWSDLVWLEYPGAPTEHLYTNQITAYYRAPHIFMGFPKRFVPSRKAVEATKYPGVSDVVFMTSRDGVHFNRWGEAFIRPGMQESRWVHRNNFVAWDIVTTKSAIPGTPDELSLYSVEGSGLGDSSQMRRFTLRIDGFVSVQAPLAGGEVVTRPLVFGGKELLINFSTSAAGSVRVEIQSAESQPIKGFTLAECPEIFGDAIEQVVVWKNGNDVSELAGKPVRLRFVMKDADLYSIRFRR